MAGVWLVQWAAVFRALALRHLYRRLTVGAGCVKAAAPPHHRDAAQWCQARNGDSAVVPSIAFWDDRDRTRPTPSWSPEQLPVLHL